MRNILKTTIGCFFAACALAGCTHNEDIQMPEDCNAERTQLQFVMHKQLPGGITRTVQSVTDGAYSTNFSDGDVVGIFVSPVAEDGANAASTPIGTDVRYKYIAENRTWEPVDEPISLPSDWTKVDIYAYYSATSATPLTGCTAISHSIQSNQSDAKNYELSDFLVAKTQLTNSGGSALVAIAEEPNGASSVTATLSFSHICSLLEVTVKSEEISYQGLQPTVKLLSAKSDMTVNLTADWSSDVSAGCTVAEGESTMDVTMLPVVTAAETNAEAKSWKFCAVVPQQTIAGNTELLEIVFRPQVPDDNGAMYKYTLPAGQSLTLSAGKLSKVSVEIPVLNTGGAAQASE